MVRVETGLLSNQGEKSINFYFTMAPLRKKVLKYGTPQPSSSRPKICGILSMRLWARRSGAYLESAAFL